MPMLDLDATTKLQSMKPAMCLYHGKPSRQLEGQMSILEASQHDNAVSNSKRITKIVEHQCIFVLSQCRVFIVTI